MTPLRPLPLFILAMSIALTVLIMQTLYAPTDTARYGAAFVGTMGSVFAWVGFSLYADYSNTLQLHSARLTQWRLLQVDALARSDRQVTRYVVQRRVTFPAGWGVWETTDEYANIDGARKGFEEDLQRHEEKIDKLAVKADRGRVGTLLAEYNGGGNDDGDSQ